MTKRSEGLSCIARNREQAKQTYPVIYWILQARHKSEALVPDEKRFGCVEMLPTREMLRAAAMFTRAVDEGKPLLDELCRILDVPRWVIRHLESCGIEAVGGYYQDRMDLPSQLARLTPELAPRTDVEYYALLAAFGRMSTGVVAPRLGQPLSVADQRAISRRARSGFRDAEYMWFLSSVGSLLDYGRSDWKENVYHDLGEPSIAEWFVLAGRLDQVERRALACLAKYGSASRSRCPNRGEDWPPLLRDWARLDDLDFYSLCSAQELESEGISLDHCVADYASRCIQRKSHILAVRRRGTRIATVEIVPRQRDGKLIWKLGQASGLKNKAIPPVVAATVDRFVGQLNEGRIPAAQEVLANMQDGLSDLPAEDAVTAYVDDNLSELLLRVVNECGASSIMLFRPLLEIQPERGKLFFRLQRALQGRDKGCARALSLDDGNLDLTIARILEDL